MGADELVTMLVRLVRDPADLEARRLAAEGLALRGQLADAMVVLAPFINFTGHEEASALPCLCKTCLAQAGDTAAAGGVGFHRTFVISGTRVLHFWLADELAADRVEVRRAVAEALRAKLKRKARLKHKRRAA